MRLSGSDNWPDVYPVNSAGCGQLVSDEALYPLIVSAIQYRFSGRREWFPLHLSVTLLVVISVYHISA